MYRLLILIVILFPILLLNGCNDEVFIEGPDMPEELKVTIGGDGGVWSREISLTSLNHIYLYGSSEAKEYITYYDNNDNIVDKEISISELKKIVYNSPVANYSVSLTGKELSIKSNYNAFSEPIKVKVCLSYDYAAKYIYLEIEQGKPLEVIEVVYDNSIGVEEDVRTETHSASYTNNSSLLQYLDFRPFNNSQAIIDITPIQQWLNGFTLDIPVLKYVDDDWELEDMNTVTVGEKIYINNINSSDVFTYEIPANKKLGVVCVITYSRASDHGIIILRNSITGEQYTVDFFCSSEYPVSHEIKLSYE